MKYQELFQCLKGVGEVDLSSFALPIANSPYSLLPVNCHADSVDSRIVSMLTDARNANQGWFLTSFVATPSRTERWLTDSVANDCARVLFVLKDLQSDTSIGYMGLAYGDNLGRRIEGDAIVRVHENSGRGLMRLAFMRLVSWARESMHFSEVWVRVIADNPAVAFYQRCNFIVVSEAPLYEFRSPDGTISTLSESPGEGATPSRRSLLHMMHEPTLGG